MNVLDQLSRFIQPLRVRVANTVTRAVISVVDGRKKLGSMQVEVLKGEDRDDLEYFQDFGFASVPEKGMEAIGVSPDGRRDGTVIIAVGDRKYRLRNLESGEVLVYDKSGSTILLKQNGDIEITAKGDVKFNGGSTPVAKEGSSTTGHMHTLSGTAGPYPISGTAQNATDSVASGQGSAKIKVP